ncbi:Phosphotransferase system mannitol/fructose-specific IIA domain (Ntr-type) [Rubritalea squalenifaciens DSM 18772]|uniref:Phosphotransferase system mannitol/fructose-specific IIA domain (Ntr-type) n=1 Tax=Rubritalea squalenifaciens DSM 18772 TaxID=1123071 RepID=A0A1M6M9C8_9BACT|nr:PTS sugar transporter subunit IIA [Rubritalea squalenifaciens]SHJ80061.1 Phosphotransferase system mannitol/fructose-specific IIA domain (Ntr-type) [Rubritalea squalenifaciens DSM 18772]
MKLASLLTVEQVMLDMKSEEHWPAIVELVEHLDKEGLLAPENKEDVLAALQVREDQISTGIGSGVAIPHAFSDKLEHVVAMFGRSKDGIDFEALDNAPVNFVLLFVVPKKDYHMHLQTLAAIAKMFNNCEVRQQLAEAETRRDILEILGSRPSRIHSER